MHEKRSCMVMINKDHLSMLVLAEAYAEKHKTEEKIKFFKKKYNKNLVELQSDMSYKKEEFEIYDDIIEWKAYENYLKDIELKIKEMQSGNIQVA